MKTWGICPTYAEPGALPSFGVRSKTRRLPTTVAGNERRLAQLMETDMEPFRALAPHLDALISKDLSTTSLYLSNVAQALLV